MANRKRLTKRDGTTCLSFCYSDRRSKLISGPSNFSHVEHMGPKHGMQKLIDLPQAQAKAGMRHSMAAGSVSGPVLRQANGAGQYLSCEPFRKQGLALIMLST